MVFVREATSADNSGLLELTKITPMEGLISLCINREPNFFSLVNLRNGGNVFVAIQNQNIIGCISISFRKVLIDKKTEIVGYISDLKVHPKYQGSRVVIDLMNELMEFAKGTGVDLYFCLIADGNSKAISLMNGWGSIPKFHPVGKFFVYEILPSPINSAPNKYKIGDATKGQLPEIIMLINDFNERYQFGSLVTEEQVNINQADNCSILTAHHDTTICATLCSFDASAVKQNVVINMPITLKIAANTLKILGKIFKFYVFPDVGEPLRMLYLRNIAFSNGNEEALLLLLQKIRYSAFQKQYSFVSIGIHENDPLRVLMKGLPKFTFVSRGFVTSVRNDEHTLSKIKSGIPFMDYTLV